MLINIMTRDRENKSILGVKMDFLHNRVVCSQDSCLNNLDYKCWNDIHMISPNSIDCSKFVGATYG